jgi:formate dehydrogenase maturation protein FdhE
VGGQFGTPNAPAGVSGGLGSLFSGSTLRTVAELAPLGALGYTLARGQPSLPPTAQAAVGGATAEQQFGASQLAAAQANQITPAQAAQIAQYKQNAQNQLYQLYAREGRDPTNDTDYLQGLQQIDQNAVAMQQQFIDAMIANGLNATNSADSTLISAANMQVASDTAFQNSIASAVQSFGLVTALNAATSAPRITVQGTTQPAQAA